eukprot:jgi/Mesen1/10764/ME000091S10306
MDCLALMLRAQLLLPPPHPPQLSHRRQQHQQQQPRRREQASPRRPAGAPGGAADSSLSAAAAAPIAQAADDEMTAAASRAPLPGGANCQHHQLKCEPEVAPAAPPEAGACAPPPATEGGANTREGEGDGQGGRGGAGSSPSQAGALSDDVLEAVLTCLTAEKPLVPFLLSPTVGLLAVLGGSLTQPEAPDLGQSVEQIDVIRVCEGMATANSGKIDTFDKDNKDNNNGLDDDIQAEGTTCGDGNNDRCRSLVEAPPPFRMCMANVLISANQKVPAGVKGDLARRMCPRLMRAAKEGRDADVRAACMQVLFTAVYHLKAPAMLPYVVDLLHLAVHILKGSGKPEERMGGAKLLAALLASDGATVAELAPFLVAARRAVVQLGRVDESEDVRAVCAQLASCLTASPGSSSQ